MQKPAVGSKADLENVIILGILFGLNFEAWTLLMTGVQTQAGNSSHQSENPCHVCGAGAFASIHFMDACANRTSEHYQANIFFGKLY